MKTTKVIALICSVLLLSCSGDNADLIGSQSSEETGIFLEQDLHGIYLRQQMDVTSEGITKIKKALRDDPDNADLQEQLKMLEHQLEELETQFNFLEKQIETAFKGVEKRFKRPRIGPFPPPPSPCNCFDRIDFTRLLQIISIGEEVKGFSIHILTEKGEEIGSFTEREVIDEGFSSISLKGQIEFRGKINVQITKFFEPVGDIIKYNIKGGI